MTCATRALIHSDVAAHSIRSRILKVQNLVQASDVFGGRSPFDPFEDTERFSVRIGSLPAPSGRSPFDPFEDTESVAASN